MPPLDTAGPRDCQVDAITGLEASLADDRTRALRWKPLDADLPYVRQDLDAAVSVPDQIRLVLQTYNDRLFTELFPGRSGEWVPKTLIFAKDDPHAEEIVKACWEVFGQGNHFAKKITCQTPEKPKGPIERFRKFAVDELLKRDKLSLDIFWLKDERLGDVDSQPAPDVIAAEIVENLQSALDAFRTVADELAIATRPS